MATDFKIQVSQDTRDYQRSMQQIIQDGKNFAKINNDITKEQNKLNRSLEQAKKLYGEQSVEVDKQRKALSDYNKHNQLVDNSVKSNLKSGDGLSGMFGNLVGKINPTTAQLGAAAQAGKVLFDQFKSTQVGGDLLENSQQSLSQGLNALGNNLIGVSVNFKSAMTQAWEFRKQVDAIEEQNLFASMFGQQARTQIAEFDLQAKQVANEIRKAKQIGDLQSVELHKKRLREIFEQRNQAVGQLLDIQRRQLAIQEIGVEKKTHDFLKSVGLDKQKVESAGLELNQVLYNQMLYVPKENPFFDKMLQDYKKLEDQTNFWTSPFQLKEGHLKSLAQVTGLTEEAQKQAFIFGTIMGKVSSKNQQEYVKQYTQLEGIKQAQISLNSETESFEQMMIRLGIVIDENGNIMGDFQKSTEKSLKTLVDLQNEQENLRKKLQEQTDPYVIRQLNDELVKTQNLINSLTRTVETTPITAPKINFNPLLTDLAGKIGQIKEQLTSGTISLIEYDSLIAKLKELELQYNKVAQAQKQGINITSGGIDFEQQKKDLNAYIERRNAGAKQEQDAGKQAQTQALQQQQAYYGLATSIGSLVEMQNFSQASVIKMVAQILPQIASLVQAKNVETVQGTTASGATSGGIPGAIQGLQVGLGLIGSILAAQNNKPRFATGGIMPGRSFQGDKNLAWLNAGEMVLTTGQQRNLFNMIESGGGFGGNISLELRGTSLIGVQNNTMNKNRQINYRYD